MSTAKNFIRTFDLFSTPFVFLVGDTKQKRTTIGGLMSFSILVVSTIYCYYLLNMYFTNKVEPKISSNNSVENNFQSISIKENFFMFEVMISGEPLKKYEQRVGKTFLKYQIQYISANSDGSQDHFIFSPIECADPQFEGYMCMNEADIIDKNIFTRPIKNELSLYAIQILACDPSTEENCVHGEEFSDFIFSDLNYLTIYIKIQQYNPQTLQYQTGYKQEFFYFDPAFYTYSKMYLTKATTTVTSGMIIQTSKTQDTIYDYKRMDSNNSVEFAKKMGYEEMAWFAFEIDQVYSQITVQHPMITEVLAQFMSIFNSLMILGIIGRMLAETKIVDDMNNMLLKEYYKRTCVSLLARKEERQKQSKYQIGVTSKQIVNLSKKISTIDISSIKQQIFKMKFLDRLKIWVLQFLKMSRREQKIDKSVGQSEEYEFIYKKLLHETTRGINIFELYKDILQLKMAIKLMLTKEQFAALRFCGSEIQTKDQFNDNNPTSLDSNQREDKQNKLEKQVSPQKKQTLIDQISSEQIPNSPQNLLFTQKDHHISDLKTYNLKDELQLESNQQIEGVLRTKSEQNCPSISFLSKNNRGKQIDEYAIAKSEYMKPRTSLFSKIQLNSIQVLPPPNEGDCAIEIKNQDEKENENSNQISPVTIQKDHLSDMDLIDESEDAQERFLDKFLQNNLSKSGQQKQSLLDMRIMQSLLINDFSSINVNDNINRCISSDNNNNINNNDDVGEIELQINKNF